MVVVVLPSHSAWASSRLTRSTPGIGVLRASALNQRRLTYSLRPPCLPARLALPARLSFNPRYVTEYDVSTRFAYVTVKGAGHMVPTYRPAEAKAMIQRFLNGSAF